MVLPIFFLLDITLETSKPPCTPFSPPLYNGYRAPESPKVSIHCTVSISLSHASPPWNCLPNSRVEVLVPAFQVRYLKKVQELLLFQFLIQMADWLHQQVPFLPLKSSIRLESSLVAGKDWSCWQAPERGPCQDCRISSLKRQAWLYPYFVLVGGWVWSCLDGF